MILGVGLQYYQEWTLYVPQMCVENDVPSELAVGSNTSANACGSVSYTVLVSVNSAVNTSTPQLANATAYLFEPTLDGIAAAIQYVNWTAGAGAARAPFACYVKKQTTALVFPDYCVGCDLRCPETQMPVLQVLLYNNVLERLRYIAFLLIAIGSSICGGCIVMFFVFITVVHERQVGDSAGDDVAVAVVDGSDENADGDDGNP